MKKDIIDKKKDGKSQAQLFFEKVGKLAEYGYNFSFPSVLLICDKGTGATAFAKEYEGVLLKNKVLTVRGTETYLSLIYPPEEESKSVFDRFFESPGIAAQFQNKYYGVFMISLLENETEDFLYSDSFNRLLTYVDNNRQITYIFRISSRCEFKEELYQILNTHLNIDRVTIPQLSYDDVTSYIVEKLGNDGISLSSRTENILYDFLKSKMDINNSSFVGYKSLDRIAEKIEYELIAENYVTGEDIPVRAFRKIEDRIILPADDIFRDSKSKIGFL